MSDTTDKKAAFSIPEFCRRNGISSTKYHDLQAKGLGPRVMRLGGATVRISAEAERDWQREREDRANPHNAEQANTLVRRARAASPFAE